MRLLICTQAVDVRDPVLGFMHRWIEGLAKRCDRVIVICLRAGEHHLPAHVEVIPLGEKRRILRALEACIVSFVRRKEYDSVFVHMNQEYVLAVGWLWRLFRKRIILWRNHKVGSFFTNIAGLFAHVVCYTSPSAYVAKFKNAQQMPIGIDTDEFKPAQKKPRSILFLGRLDAVKNVHVFVAALDELKKEGVEFNAQMYGEPTEKDSAYAADVRRAAEVLESTLELHSSVTNAEAARLFASSDIYVNLTPSGSFDKTIGEAMASGCIAVAANEALTDILPPTLVTRGSDSPEVVAEKIQNALSLPEQERAELAKKLRTYVEEEHSLALLSERLLGIVKP